MNSTSHRFTANGSFTLSEKLTLTLTDTYLKTSEIEDIREIPDIGPITQRYDMTMHSVSGNISYRFTGRLTYTLGASYSETYSEDEDFDEVTTYSGNTGFTYRYSERTTLSINAVYSRTDYSTSSDATGQNYSLGITYILSPTLTAALTGGVAVTEIEDTDETSTDFSGGVDITKTFERGSATLSYRQTVIPSIETGTPVRSQTVRLYLIRPLLERWIASVSGSYSNFKSINADDIDRDEIRFDTNLTYNFRQWASLVLSYSYVDSNDKTSDEDDYYNHIVLLSIRLSHSKRL
ncbi:MAG: hypothetical protein AB1610_06745 [Nitrospirota bacterium]